ncbi:unnamed protein product [Leptidea sinapis]|uniref:NR LBD domain-containing protein n=1 Tax=Leptidea sinapis TaxID=189913 RepID=A0A5E4QBI3_9NEOP|nr:unnamed protein product [Leptidea sinapis]
MLFPGDRLAPALQMMTCLVLMWLDCAGKLTAIIQNIIDWPYDPRDMALVSGIFDVAKSIARLKLTETELALYQSLVLLWPEIQCLFNMSMAAMRHEIETNHAPIKGDVTVLDTLLAKIPTFRELSLMHLEALCRFKTAHPHHVFPALYKELFSLDNVLDYTHG